MLIAERLFYWHGEPFRALKEAAALKEGEKEPLECVGRKVSWVKRDWRARDWHRAGLGSEPRGLRRSRARRGQDGVPCRTELFWVRMGQI